MLWEHVHEPPLRGMPPQLFHVLPSFHEYFNNSIETRSTWFIFLQETPRREKGKQLVNLIIKM